jgi:ribosomal protein S12 methylthiotransferase accessory factor
MAPRGHPLRDGPRALARALGVTRIARLTGLDRTGVEVASAIRPGAHVLQVTNGKGETPTDAAAGALLEAAELFAAERAAVDAWGSAAELAGSGADAVHPRDLADGGGEPEWDHVRLAWRSGRDLATGAPVLVPGQLVHVPPPGGPLLGPALLRWTSNGMGAARDPSAALLHALLEAVERDRVARALPEGFTKGELARRLLDPARLASVAPRTAALAARIEAEGIRVFLLDVTDADPGPGRGLGLGPGPGPRPRPGPGPSRGRGRGPSRGRGPRPGPRPSPGPGWLSLPCCAALLLDREGSAVPVAAGYACRLSRDGALRAALLEAAQSRATEIHGAREDVAAGDRGAAEALRGLLEGARAARDPSHLPEVRAASPSAGVRAVVARLRRAGLRPLAVDLQGPPGVHVCRAVVPGLLLSELL